MRQAPGLTEKLEAADGRGQAGRFDFVCLVEEKNHFSRSCYEKGQTNRDM